MTTPAKYSDVLADWLVELGYTTCFFVAGGNIMHLLESCSRKLRCIAVVHEVAAGIAAEYFNEVSKGEKAVALVTAGPGLTNILTAMAGAWLESRELLVLGGQVKVADLSHGKLRQNGIQEICGVELARPIAVAASELVETVDFATFAGMVRAGSAGRKGPVFIEIPLDVQARSVDVAALQKAPVPTPPGIPAVAPAEQDALVDRIRHAARPLLLIGGGITRETAAAVLPALARMGVPVTTTWNAADRVPASHPLYFGRPNTWGQRYSNLLLQQADLVVALGTRLGLQQTGFNWQEFVPRGQVVQVECDRAELEKGHPRVDVPLCGDANPLLRHLAAADLGDHVDWVGYCRCVQAAIPLDEGGFTPATGFITPHACVAWLSANCQPDDTVIPCSSGSAFTVMMQMFQQKQGQIMVTNKGLASMGYGLSGAIGAAIAGNGKRTILVEGDGGFSQNLQEVGTAAVNKLNLKIFLFDDNGYASIRMTQSNYFGGRYVGCDLTTGLGLPNWERLFSAYDVPALRLAPGFANDPAVRAAFDRVGPAAFIVPIDPKQSYFPKITSRVTATGGMVSNPLHRMSPDLDEATQKKVGRYF